MTSPPPGDVPNDPMLAASRGSSAAQPGRGSGAALAGFLCGLGGFMAMALAALLAGGLGIRPLARTLERLHDALVPGTTSGEGMLLFTAAVPVAVVGLVLSLRGRHARQRRWLAVAGMALTAFVIVCYGVLLVILWREWSQAFRYGLLPGLSGQG